MSTPVDRAGVAQGAAMTHERAVGALCADDGTGSCVGCGVALTTCESCQGVGYHADLCSESDETICLALVRAELDASLRRADLHDLGDALASCDAELLAAIRRLDLQGRDNLTTEELARLRCSPWWSRLVRARTSEVSDVSIPARIPA